MFLVLKQSGAVQHGGFINFLSLIALFKALCAEPFPLFLSIYLLLARFDISLPLSVLR